MAIKPTTHTSNSVSMLHFFGLTYLLSWLIWIPLDMSHFGIGPFHVSEGISIHYPTVGSIDASCLSLDLDESSRRTGCDPVTLGSSGESGG